MIFENLRKWLLTNKDCYVAKVQCNNCDHVMLIKIPKGKKVNEIKNKNIFCKKCGLKEIEDASEEYY